MFYGEEDVRVTRDHLVLIICWKIMYIPQGKCRERVVNNAMPHSMRQACGPRNTATNVVRSLHHLSTYSKIKKRASPL